MARGDYTIGWLSRRTNTKVQTIRYYEQIGLMPTPPRSEGNRRLYGSEQADRMAFIRHSRELGFPLGQVRELLALSDEPDRPCEEANEIAQRQLVDVEARIAKLEGLRSELQRMVHECGGGRISKCRVIEILSDHSLCLAEGHDRAS